MLDQNSIEMEHLLPDEYTFLAIREQLQSDIITLCLTYEIDEYLVDKLCVCVMEHYDHLGKIL